MTRTSRLLPSLILVVLTISSHHSLWAQTYPPSLFQEMHWRLVGPFRGGRTRAVAGVPSQPNVFYVGAVNGGVWKSDDYGRTWLSIFDSQPTQSIGAIAVSPSNPDVIYVASGEGLQRPDLSVGDGIYKSTDGGKSWTHLGLRDSQQIPALAIDPTNPNRIFAAVLGHPYGPNAERGIFRSTDGGATWEKVLYKDENTGGSDVEIDPTNPDIIYACLWQSRLGPTEDHNAFAGIGGGLFKSTDGGTTWHELGKGLPEGLQQINVAIAASHPQRLYATVSRSAPNPADYATGNGVGFFRSDDAGETWTRITDDPRPAMKIGGGDLAIPKVDPKNPDIVYSTSIVTIRSSDGGKTWESLRGAPGGDDYQNMWINPENPQIILLVADQGAIITVNGGQTWSSWYNQPTAQLFHVITDNSFPYKVCGAQQESGSVCINSRGNNGEITFRDWHPVGVIEYGYVAPDPLDRDIVYGAGRSEVSRFHWSTGQAENVTPIPLRDDYRVDRTEPLVFSPVDPHLLFYAANVVFETRDGGRNWQVISPDLTRANPGIPSSVGDQAKLNPNGAKGRGTIYALAPSFHDVNTLWAGTDDGQVWVTRDGGKNWSNVTPPGVAAWNKVTQISASHFDNSSAYVSISNFRIDDLHPHIYRTHDGGKSWQEIVAGLPDNSPVNTIREDLVKRGLLFAGTETAIWTSFDDGDHWQSLQLNLPHTSMRDLWIHEDDLVVATHGRSFWILDDISPLRQLSPAITSSAAYLLDPVPAYRIARDTNTDTPLPADEPAGQNPPDGAILDYFLEKTATGPIILEILDDHGKLVHRFSSDDKPEQTQSQLEQQLIPLYWIRPARTLSAEEGMHRWIWDLRYAAPLSTQHEYPIAAVPHDTPRYPLGPAALPGKYAVRLTVDGHAYETALTIKMDPRVKTSEADLRQLFEYQTRLASLLSESSQAVWQARSVEEQLDELSQTSSPDLLKSIKALRFKVSTLLEGRTDLPEAPSLSAENGDAVDLYKGSSLGVTADAAPTAAQIKAASEVRERFSRVAKQWQQLKRTDLPSLNRDLTAAGLPSIQLERPPKQLESGSNEE